MKIIIVFAAYIVIIVAISIFFGCEGQPLDVLLDQSGKHSTDIVSEISGCYTGLDIDAEAGEYLAIFSKACVDNVLGVEVSDPEGVELSDKVPCCCQQSHGTGHLIFQTAATLLAPAFRLLQ